MRKILLSSSLLVLFTACGLPPNTLWEVSRLDTPRPNSCYPGGRPPNNTTTTMGVETNVGPWELYEGPDERQYLVLGDKRTVINGTRDGDIFDFPYTVTMTNVSGAPLNATTTSTATNSLNFTLKSDTLSGTWQIKETYSCAGTDCGTLTLTPNCDLTHEVKGRRLDASQYKTY